MKGKKLVLNKETVRQLTDSQLSNVVGGRGLGFNTLSVPGCICSNTGCNTCSPCTGANDTRRICCAD